MKHLSFLVIGVALSATRALAQDAEAGSEGVSGAPRAVLDAMRAVWEFRLVNVEDRPISVGTIVVSLVVLGVGYAVAQRVSLWIGRALQDRLKLEQGPAFALERISFYALFIGVVLFTLRTVNFPLTVFTLLGGAAAIGLGFGSQNVMNNFISGLILLVERPVSAGDLIEVDGTFGVVERIGARSTQVRASDNTHLIIPNSAFLENNVRNWSFSDDVVRAEVAVGVAYGSPTRDVERLLRKAIEGHPEILPDWEPVILFTEFGDNALNFLAYFWIQSRRVINRRRIESDLRYRIDELFREAGIAIAFPQRDVHLDAAAPLQVELVASDPSGDEQ